MRPLSPKMEATLERLADGEAPVKEIGHSTVQALMNRGLVEVSSDFELVSLPTHKHSWKMGMHLDGCHHFSTAYSCVCGAKAGMHGERGMSSADPYAAVWLMPDECERCSELMAGARPRFDTTIVRPALVAA